MIDLRTLDERPLIVAVAGPNGAGKTTFIAAHLDRSALRVIEADRLSRELRLEPYDAAQAADTLRRVLVARRESFIFETVFSDPAGDKIGFLGDAATAGYTVVLCFVGISGPKVSEERVSMRVSQGGHDVPPDKLASRFPRTLVNLAKAVRVLPHVLVFDNDDLARPYRLTAVFKRGELVSLEKPVPPWVTPLL